MLHCLLYTVLYLGDIITKWQKEGIPLSKNLQILTLLFSNNQVILFNIEDNLQEAV
jgi:hypothetical protein